MEDKELYLYLKAEEINETTGAFIKAVRERRLFRRVKDTRRHTVFLHTSSNLLRLVFDVAEVEEK